MAPCPLHEQRADQVSVETTNIERRQETPSRYDLMAMTVLACAEMLKLRKRLGEAP